MEDHIHVIDSKNLSTGIGLLVIEAAQKEAQLRRNNLEAELEQERKSMEDDIKKEIVDIAFQAAEKIVGREVNRDKYFDVVDEILKGAN